MGIQALSSRLGWGIQGLCSGLSFLKVLVSVSLVGVLLFMVCGGGCGDCVFWWGFGCVLDVVYGVFYLLGFVDGCVQGVVQGLYD